MKFVEPDVEILKQNPGFQGVYDAICKAASTCYRATPKSGESAKAFVNTLIKSGHMAMLEFGTIYLTIPIKKYIYSYGKVTKSAAIKKYQENPYSRVFISAEGDKAYITTNYRAIIENSWEKDLDYMALYPTEYHIKRYAARFTISIGIGREFLRHRKMSFANESTRYCNYSKEKFNKEITFVLPSWSKIQAGEYGAPLLKPEEVSAKDFVFSWGCYNAEKFYFDMIEDGATPQEAREVLPLSTKSELCMCGFEDDWKHFFDLRMRGTTGKPHPDAQYIATKWWELLKEKGIIL